MVTKILVDRDIEGGRKLIESLDQENIPVSAAMWFYDNERERYRLVLATSLYDSKGPLEAYRDVRRVLDTLPEDSRPDLTDINVVSPSDRVVQAIHTAVQTGAGIAGVRFARNTVDGLYVDDAWIYRS